MQAQRGAFLHLIFRLNLKSVQTDKMPGFFDLFAAILRDIFMMIGIMYGRERR
jgi:hypothetical protein